MIEALVCLAIIGALMGLLLPAVQAVRESARRVHCASNLRQIGLALNHYAAAFGCLPQGNTTGYSAHASILPFLELMPVYNAINFQTKARDVSTASANSSVSQVSLSAFTCPSDSVPQWGRFSAWTSYACNRGASLHGESPTNGSFALDGLIGFQGFTDGTSNTVAMSEWVLGPLTSTSDRLGPVFAVAGNLWQPDQFDRFIAECRSLTGAGAVIANDRKGAIWLYGDYIATHYNHSLSPDEPSCMSAGMVQLGAFTASSRHLGGVHSLFADGHVRFEPAKVNVNVWRSIGTRNGGEPISDGSF